MLVMNALGNASEDLRAGALYRPAEQDATDSPTLVRAGMFGPACESHFPEVVDGADHPVARAWSGGSAVVERHDCPAEGEAAVLHASLPVRVQDDAGAVLVLSPHPLRPYDEDHERFAGLVADQVGQILAVATERAREQSRLEALAALDAAKTAFLSNVSHEFRTPLTLLLGPLEDVLSGRTLDHRQGRAGGDAQQRPPAPAHGQRAARRGPHRGRRACTPHPRPPISPS